MEWILQTSLSSITVVGYPGASTSVLQSMRLEAHMSYSDHLRRVTRNAQGLKSSETFRAAVQPCSRAAMHPCSSASLFQEGLSGVLCGSWYFDQGHVERLQGI